METIAVKEKGPEKKVVIPKRKCVLKKLDMETAKILSSLKEKANKKSYGRKVTDSEVLAAAIRLLGPDHLKELQEATYSERDRLEMAHEDYQKAFGKLSMDQFIGRLLKGEIKIS